MISLLKLSEIKRTTEMQPRATMQMAVAEDYAEDIKAGARFPPLTVFHVGEEYILVDGFHRALALQSAGLKKAQCEVLEGTMRDAFLHASGVNAGHGLRRTNDDKRRAVERLLRDPEWSQWSDNKIAEICKVSDKTVARYRDGVTSEIRSEDGSETPKTRLFATKHGGVARMNTEKIGKKPAHAFTELHDGKPVPEPKTVSQIDQEQVRRDEIAEAARNQPAISDQLKKDLDEAAKEPSIPWTIDLCKTGKCPDGQDHTNRDDKRQVVGCAGSGYPLKQISHCPIIDRMRKAAEGPGTGFVRASGAPDIDPHTGGKIIKPGGIRVVKTPLTADELRACADDLIERSGFFTPKEVGLVDELIRAGHEGIHSRADFIKVSCNWFLTSAGGE